MNIQRGRDFVVLNTVGGEAGRIYDGLKESHAPGFTLVVISELLVTPWPDYLYLSLGDREHRTNNSFLKMVQENAVEIIEFYKNKGIETVFVSNPGGHFKQADERLTAGIAWLLER